jgi:glycosyltransferase involved in cell wall biosynthesis
MAQPAPVRKVLHVIPSVSEKHGGPSYAIRAFANASKAAGIHVTIATTDDDGDGARLGVPLNFAMERDGVTHFFFKRDVLPYKISFGLARWLNRNVRQFDVVHIHALFSFSSYTAARSARRRGVPYIVRPLGVLNRWGLQNRRPLLKSISFKLIELPLLRQAAAIHYTSEAERHEAASLHRDIANRPSFIIPVPVETTALAAVGDGAAFFQRFPQAADKKVILFLSRIAPKKGLELLFKAFAAIKSNMPDCILVIAGDGDQNYIDSLRAEAAQLGILDEILWTGFLGPTAKITAYAAASVFVLPSHSENFGIAVAEAMACGVPVITTKATPWEEVKAQRCGWWVDIGVEPLETALRDVLKMSPTERYEMGLRGRQLIESKYAGSRVATRMEEMYRWAITGARNPEGKT